VRDRVERRVVVFLRMAVEVFRRIARRPAPGPAILTHPEERVAGRVVRVRRAVGQAVIAVRQAVVFVVEPVPQSAFEAGTGVGVVKKVAEHNHAPLRLNS
jgi:hypothetical protein